MFATLLTMIPVRDLSEPDDMPVNWIISVLKVLFYTRTQAF
jgi:hypothetical protein